MKRPILWGFAVLCLLLAAVLSAEAYAFWIWSPETKTFVNPEGTVQDTAEEQFTYAMKLYSNGETGEAVKELSKLLKEYPTSTTAPKAQFQLAVLHEDAGSPYKAFEAHRDLWRTYPQSDQLDESLKRAFQIGNVFLSGKKGKVLGLAVVPVLPRAEEVFSEIGTWAPYSEWGDRAQFSLGLARKQMAKYQEAIQAFQDLVDRYPRSEFVPDARYQMAECTLLYSAQGERDDRVFQQAQSRFDTFLKQYPGSSSFEKAQALKREVEERKAEKDFLIGKYYEDRHYLDSARIYYEGVAAEYADTAWGKRAAERLEKLKSPEKFWRDREEVLAKDLASLEQKERALAQRERDVTGQPIQGRERELLNAEKKSIVQDEQALRRKLQKFKTTKVQEFRSRQKALDREGQALREKHKTLKQKAKLLKRNPSPDLNRAIERWQDSLAAEELSLARRRGELENLRRAWGVGPNLQEIVGGWVSGRPSPERRVEKLLQYRAHDLASIGKKRHRIRVAKRSLYRERETLEHAQRAIDLELINLVLDKKEFRHALARGPSGLERKRLALEEEERRLAFLEERLAVRRHMLGLEAGALRFPAERGVRLEALIRERELRRRHLARAVRAKRAEIQSTHNAFEMAFESLPAQVLPVITADSPQRDSRQARKALKDLERRVRQGIDEIRDRKRAKQKRIADLAEVLREARRERRPRILEAGHKIARPGFVFLELTKAFFVGVEEEETRVDQQARRDTRHVTEEWRGQIQALREAIALENVMIAARAFEVRTAENELLKLRAETMGNRPTEVRSILPATPRGFVNQAHSQAALHMSTDAEKGVLIDRLDRETRTLAELERELRNVNMDLAAARAQRLRRARPQAEPPGAPAPAAPRVAPAERRARAGHSLARFERVFAAKRARFERARLGLERELAQVYRTSPDASLRESIRVEERKLFSKLDRLRDHERETSQSILKLLDEEQALLGRERELVAQKIDRFEQSMSQRSVADSAASSWRSRVSGERERLATRLTSLDRASGLAQRERRQMLEARGDVAR